MDGHRVLKLNTGNPAVVGSGAPAVGRVWFGLLDVWCAGGEELVLPHLLTRVLFPGGSPQRWVRSEHRYSLAA